MSFIHHPTVKKSNRHWFVLIAFMAMTMNLLASTGFVHSVAMAGGAGRMSGGFTGEICTTVGLVKSPTTQQDSLPASSTNQAHPCCGICLTGGAPLVSAGFDGVSPAPTGEIFVSVFVAPQPTLLLANSHRPRGPPLV